MSMTGVIFNLRIFKACVKLRHFGSTPELLIMSEAGKL
jgi:hypothetical protein